VPKFFRFLFVTVALVVLAVVDVPLSVPVAALKSWRTSFPNTVTTPTAAMAMSATMIKYSVIPCPDSERKKRDPRTRRIHFGNENLSATKRRIDVLLREPRLARDEREATSGAGPRPSVNFRVDSGTGFRSAAGR
jgi:hypothetical protein